MLFSSSSIPLKSMHLLDLRTLMDEKFVIGEVFHS